MKITKKSGLVLGMMMATFPAAYSQTTVTDSTKTESKLQQTQHIGEVTVTGIVRKNSQAGMVQQTRKSAVVENNVSAEEISKTQDANAGEVIRRIPGVSLIDNKFVMVRGLSQRYNNVWINGGAVPSMEPDSRAFSFDILPSSQIDNLVVVKTPSAEYPADYTGGFIIVNTKEIPVTDVARVSLGWGMNDQTVFRHSLYGKESGTDFLGFDNGLRSLKGGINATLNPVSNGASLTGNSLNNDWTVHSHIPWGDMRLSAELARHFRLFGLRTGMMAAFNYTNEWRTYEDMQNNLFGVYDAQNDKQNYLRYSVDDQYNHNVRLGAMLNFTLLSRSGYNKYQWKNIFNQYGKSRYTWREGVSAQSDQEESSEFYYRSRTTFDTQFTGKHNLRNDNDVVEWSAAYAYAGANMPDRRRWKVDDELETGTLQLTTGNDVSREWTDLGEHIFSINATERHTFTFGHFAPTIKGGIYGEYRTRKYTTRDFYYNWNAASNQLPDGFRQMDMAELLSNEQYFGADGLYLLEQVKWRNNYRGHNTLGAAFLTATLPLGRFSAYLGLRFEHNDMALISNTRDAEKSESTRHYKSDDLFPSVNLLYRFNDKHQLRLAYGRTVNRPEFREYSSSVYYDFDLASNVQGNTELTNCYIDNLDLRYEFYPSRGEMVSLAAFYKHFDSPIEWTYTVTGGTDLVYSFENANAANSFGLELDVKKDLSFLLTGLSWAFNGSLIHSRVDFPKGSRNENRPMQGQSPYLVNTGLFYHLDQANLDLSLLYNRIGRRIIGVGRSEGTTGSEDNARVPDSYEMPRNTIDLSASMKLGRHWEMRASVRDLLAEKVYYKQFADVTLGDGSTKKVTEIDRCYKPGRNWQIGVTYKF
jgi:outer membrane receptor for ferrienterochelin and colicin